MTINYRQSKYKTKQIFNNILRNNNNFPKNNIKIKKKNYICKVLKELLS